MFRKIIKSTWDCIRFPFLYPRNRWTGLHYNNWSILDWVKRMKDESSMFLNLSLHDSPIQGSKILELGDGRVLSLENKRDEIKVYLGKLGGHFDRRVATLKAPGLVLDSCFGEKPGEINVQINSLPEEPIFISTRVIHKPLLWIGTKIVDWFHTWPLQIFHCLTSYTELEALDKGWRIAFGKDLCKDLRRALWKEGRLKALLRFRITQIKEKWGYLHFYYSGGGEEVQKVISKYETLSSKTCIVCGKPATYRTTGWICPYCDDCIGDKDYAEKIDENEEG